MFFKRKVNEELFRKLKKSYAAQLRRKDEIIETLKKENDLLMKTAIRQSDNTTKWMEYAKKLEKKIAKSRKKKTKS